MKNNVYLKNWSYDGDKIKLEYKDETILYVSREDFNRAFGPIISSTKDEVERDFCNK